MQITEDMKRQILVLAANDLQVYCELMNPNWRPFRHLLYIVAKLEAIARGELHRLIVTCPPQHGKSLLVSQLFPAWYLGRHPNRKVITTTYSADKAEDYGRYVRDQLQDDRYRAVFPGCSLRRDTQAVSRMYTTAGGEYHAVGRQGSQTGRGANLFLIDDPYKDEKEAHSEAIRREIRGWYNKVVSMRMSADNGIVVIHTRWAEDDLIGWLIAEHPHEAWQVVNLPGVAMEGDPLGRNLGEPLCPELHPLEQLEDHRKNDPIGFEALIQQRPAGAGARMFRREWLESSAMHCRYNPIDQMPPWRTMPKLMLIDPAHTKKLSSDYTTIFILGLGADRRFWILDMLRDRLNQVERADAVFRLHRQWMQSRIPASWVFWEQFHLDDSYIADRMARENYRFPIFPLGGNIPKPDRIGWLVGPISQAHYMIPLFMHRKNLAGVEEDLIRIFIETEYANYLVGGGGVVHDDMLDNLARTQDPAVRERITWPRPGESADPNEVLRAARARHRAAGGTWAGL